MESQTPNNSKVTTQEKVIDEPYKADVYQAYVLWKSLPYFLKKLGAEEAREKMGIEDITILELIDIKTQQVFAERFDVMPDTLSAWNKTILKRDALADVREWARRLAKNVVLAMYNNSLSRNRNAHNDRLNFLKYVGFNEKSILELEAGNSLADIMKREIAERKKIKESDGNT